MRGNVGTWERGHVRARNAASVVWGTVLVLVVLLLLWAQPAAADCQYHTTVDFPDIELCTVAPPAVTHAGDGTLFDVDVYAIVLNLGSGHGYIPAPLRIPSVNYGWRWVAADDGSESYAIEPVCIAAGDELDAAGLCLQFGYDVVEPCGDTSGLPWCLPPWDWDCRTRLYWTLGNGHDYTDGCTGDVLLADVGDVIHVATVTFRTTGYEVGPIELWPRIEYGPNFVWVWQDHPSGGCSWIDADVCGWDYWGVPIEIVTHPVTGPGDMNCDGAVNMDDVPLFAQAFGYPGGAGWPHCDWWRADCDQDGDVDYDDVPAFVARLE